MLRAVGPVLLIAGVVLLLIGGSALVGAFLNAGSGDDVRMARMILMLPGLLLFGLGMQTSLVGWMGSVMKYGVRESAPAAAEGINRVGMGAKQGIEAISAAVVSGLREDAEKRVPCAACGDVNDSDARFCDACGKAVAPVCGDCGTVNDTGAKFCDQCGATLG